MQPFLLTVLFVGIDSSFELAVLPPRHPYGKVMNVNEGGKLLVLRLLAPPIASHKLDIHRQKV